MTIRVILLGILLAGSYAANMTWHHSPDCSDAPYNLMTHFPAMESTVVPSDCKAGSTFNFGTEDGWHPMQVDAKWDKCNDTHFGMSIYVPESECTAVAGTLAIPTKDVKKVFRGECVKVFSECCEDDGQPRVPQIEYVQMSHYTGPAPHCPHCIKVPRSTYDRFVSHGILPLTCEEDKRRRRLEGLPEGAPCPGSAKARNLLKTAPDRATQAGPSKPSGGPPRPSKMPLPSAPLNPFWNPPKLHPFKASSGGRRHPDIYT